MYVSYLCICKVFTNQVSSIVDTNICKMYLHAKKQTVIKEKQNKNEPHVHDSEKEKEKEKRERGKKEK
jgi:hypothetical protein